MGRGSDEILAQLGADGAVLPNNVAEDRDLGVEDAPCRCAPRTTERETSPSGASTRQPLLSAPRLGQHLAGGVRRPLRPAPQPVHTARRRRRRSRGEPGVEQALADFPDTRLQTRQEWIDKEDREIQQFLLLLYVLLALSVIISLFGMVNTLALSVFERTREIGMLRAVGMTRRQTRRMIRLAGVITALIGAALGLPLGILLAALVTRALGQYDIRFDLPEGQLVVLADSVVAGLLAAVTPARRAAKLDPLRALRVRVSGRGPSIIATAALA